jgi:hypothetical protein
MVWLPVEIRNLEKVDIAMDFIYGLDNSCYAEFKAKIVNNIQKGILTQPQDLNTIYIMASQRAVVRSTKDTAGGATFATIESTTKQKQGETPSDGKEETKEQKAAEPLAKIKCFNCGEKRHMARNCLHKIVKMEDEEPPMAGMTLEGCCSTSSNGRRLHKWYENCHDNGSVNIVDPRLLSNLCTACKTYHSMNGMAETIRVGHLDGFFECPACDACPANILSMADVEDMYAMTYVQGECIIVHMEDHDMSFERRDKMCVADFSDWIVDDKSRVSEMYTGLSLMTAEEREREPVHKKRTIHGTRWECT